MTIFKKFHFDAAHYLPNVPEEHKCRALHGHTYQLTIFITDALATKEGWVMDFAIIKQKIKTILAEIDHKLLNEVEGLENPTCEHVTIWLWKKIKTAIPALEKIELYETPTSGAVYSGE